MNNFEMEPVNKNELGPLSTDKKCPRFFVTGSGARELVGFRGPLTQMVLERGWEVVAASSEETQRELDWYNQHKIHYFRLPLQRTGMNPLADIGFYRYLKRLFNQIQPDAFLFYTHKPMIFGSLAASNAGFQNINALLPGLGYGFSKDGRLKTKVAKFCLKTLHNFSKNRIQNLFFVNPNDHEDFKNENLIGSKVRVEVLPGEGKDLRHYEYRTPQVKEQKFVFNLITRLLEAKGVRDFVETSRILKQEHGEKVVFDLLGPFDTTPGGVPEHDIRAWNDEGLIDYHGQVEDVRPFFENCHATILPTVYREGLPNVLLEAMAIGRPIITYRNAGCTQTVENPQELEPGLCQGTNGFLIEPGRVDLLVKSVKKLIAQPELVTEMGKAGRRFAQEKFDVDVINALILERMAIHKVN